MSLKRYEITPPPLISRYRQEDEDEEFEHQPKSDKKASSSSTPPPPKTTNIAKIPAHLVKIFFRVTGFGVFWQFGYFGKPVTFLATFGLSNFFIFSPE